MTTELLVADATCGHCKASIETAVANVDGVVSAQLDLETKVLTVSHEDEVDADAVAQAISEAGYTPEAVA